MPGSGIRGARVLSVGLRAVAVVVLLGAIHAAAILARGRFKWAVFGYDEHSDLSSQIWYGVEGAGICATAAVAAWGIFLLSDVSRLRGAWTRLAGLLTGSGTGPTMADKVFVGLAAGTAAVYLSPYLLYAIR